MTTRKPSRSDAALRRNVAANTNETCNRVYALAGQLPSRISVHTSDEGLKEALEVLKAVREAAATAELGLRILVRSKL